MTVINNAVPVIDNARRAQVRDVPQLRTMADLDGSQREAAWGAPPGPQGETRGHRGETRLGTLASIFW